jgi:hypothetical protein
MSLVGGGRLVMPHPELRRVESSVDEQLFHCVSCDAFWGIEKLGWARLIR